VEIKVNAKNGTLPESVQETIHNKVAKLPRFFDRTTAINVIVDLKHTDNPKVEVKVSAEETDDFFAADTGSNVIVALDSVIDKVERQLRRHKEKLTAHRGRNTSEN
jgi:putative sigma-54 modulation protein